MNSSRFRISCATLLAVLALAMLLVLPFAAFSQPTPYQAAAADSTGCCGGCPVTPPAEAPLPTDGCCAAEGCCSACSAPLGTRVLLPVVAPVVGRLAATDPLVLFPEVYLPIFVPPESRS